MRVPKSPVEHYMSERILSFAYLMCPSVSKPKAQKKACLRFAIFNFSEKLQNIFEIALTKIWSVLTKIDLIEKNISQTRFGCLCVNLSTIEIWGNQSNSL